MGTAAIHVGTAGAAQRRSGAQRALPRLGRAWLDRRTALASRPPLPATMCESPSLMAADVRLRRELQSLAGAIAVDRGFRRTRRTPPPRATVPALLTAAPKLAQNRPDVLVDHNSTSD